MVALPDINKESDKLKLEWNVYTHDFNNCAYNDKHFSEITFEGKGQLSFSGDFQPLCLPGETCSCYFTEQNWEV